MLSNAKSRISYGLIIEYFTFLNIINCKTNLVKTERMTLLKIFHFIFGLDPTDVQQQHQQHIEVNWVSQLGAFREEKIFNEDYFNNFFNCIWPFFNREKICLQFFIINWREKEKTRNISKAINKQPNISCRFVIANKTVEG